MITLASSAPLKPGVMLRDLLERGVRGRAGAWRRAGAGSPRRPCTSGTSIVTWRSKRPGRSSAGSRMSGRLVAPITTRPPSPEKPSISTSSAFSVCSRSSLPWPMPAPRLRPAASNSSMKMIAGAVLRALRNRSRTRAAPTPTSDSTKSEPDSEKNEASASPATALASSVLPVPGGPTSKHALGRRRAHRQVTRGVVRGSRGSRAARPPPRPRRRRRANVIAVGRALAFALPFAGELGEARDPARAAVGADAHEQREQAHEQHDRDQELHEDRRAAPCPTADRRSTTAPACVRLCRSCCVCDPGGRIRGPVFECAGVASGALWRLRRVARVDVGRTRLRCCPAPRPSPCRRIPAVGIFSAISTRLSWSSSVAVAIWLWLASEITRLIGNSEPWLEGPIDPEQQEERDDQRDRGNHQEQRELVAEDEPAHSDQRCRAEPWPARDCAAARDPSAPARPAAGRGSLRPPAPPGATVAAARDGLMSPGSAPSG